MGRPGLGSQPATGDEQRGAEEVNCQGAALPCGGAARGQPMPSWGKGRLREAAACSIGICFPCLAVLREGGRRGKGEVRHRAARK